MTLLILSFLAGVLTIAAPCILTLLPVMLGGTLTRSSDQKNDSRNWQQPLIIAASLGGSIILFTLLLKATTALLGVPQQAWQILAGGILICLGISFLRPAIWETIALKSGLYGASNKLLGRAFKQKGSLGSVFIGASLGPVFSSCSPTYAFVVAAVIPVAFAEGLLYLFAYAFGTALTLLLIAYLGQSFAQKLGWLSNPNGKLKLLIGVLFIIIGIAIIFQLEKRVETYLLDKGWYAPIVNLEQSIRE